MTMSPPATGNDRTTGTNEPITHTSWNRVSKRAKARPWCDSRHVALDQGVEGRFGHRPGHSDDEGQQGLVPPRGDEATDGR